METARLDLLVAALVIEVGDGLAPVQLSQEEREGYRSWLGFTPALRVGRTLDGAALSFEAYHRLFAALVGAMSACEGDAAIVLDHDAQLVRRLAGAVSVQRNRDLVGPEMLTMIPRPFTRRALKYRHQ